MGYYLQAFVCKTVDSHWLTNKFDKATSIEMAQGVSLIPMTEELFDQVNNFSAADTIGSFQYLNENIENNILHTIGSKPFSYTEAEYFGGQGGQKAIIWEAGRRFQLLPEGHDRINQVLRYFGAIAANGQDEFQTLGFGKYRHTQEWIGNFDW